MKFYAKILRQAWGLGPEALCCSAYTYIDFSSKKIQQNYEGLTITVGYAQQGKL